LNDKQAYLRNPTRFVQISFCINNDVKGIIIDNLMSPCYSSGAVVQEHCICCAETRHRHIYIQTNPIIGGEEVREKTHDCQNSFKTGGQEEGPQLSCRCRRFAFTPRWPYYRKYWVVQPPRGAFRNSY